MIASRWSSGKLLERAAKILEVEHAVLAGVDRQPGGHQMPSLSCTSRPRLRICE